MRPFLAKLAHRLYERLPASRRLYFIYTHNNGYNRFANGLKANTEISYWSYRALREAFPRVRFLRLQGEHPSRIRTIGPRDVVIGHVGETYALAALRTRRLIAFCPWAGHEDRSQVAFNCAPADLEMEAYKKACALIFLTSEYNVREYIEKPRNFWFNYLQELNQKRRIRIVHQPIDLNLFCRIKQEYRTNNFLYIGNDAHMKCLPHAKELVAHVKRELTLYGCEGKTLNHLDKKVVNLLPAQADFFIQPGMWEAQCVSILEAAARGFIPIVTRETGYPYDHPFLLRYGDFAYNCNVLSTLLATSAHERKVLADTLHSKLMNDINHNSWSRLTDVLVEEVQRAFA